VTVNGVRLGNGTDIATVLFGAAPAALVSQSETQAVVTAPAGSPGSVSVTVQSESSGTTTAANGFTFT
jgi:hypothetical protein